MKLQPARYYVRCLKTADGSPDIIFDDALLVPISRSSAEIVVLDPEKPFGGPIKQRDYTKQSVAISAIVYTISLLAYGEETVEDPVVGDIKAGISEHHDEVFEHQFKKRVIFRDSVLMASGTHLIKLFTIPEVFPQIKAPGKVLQFIA